MVIHDDMAANQLGDADAVDIVDAGEIQVVYLQSLAVTLPAMFGGRQYVTLTSLESVTPSRPAARSEDHCSTSGLRLWSRLGIRFARRKKNPGEVVRRLS